MAKQVRGSTWQAVALMVSTAVGAGVLAIPGLIVAVGVPVGLILLGVLGFAMIIINLYVADLLVRQKHEMQLPGLIKRTLGSGGATIMAGVNYLAGMGALVAYLIGQGQGLQALFGGSSFVWSLVFFGLALFVVSRGLASVKKAEMILVVLLAVVVAGFGVYSFPHIELQHFSHQTIEWWRYLAPYGVVLFAFHATASIPEANSLLRGKVKAIRRSVIWSGVLGMILYAVFTLLVVGVTGPGTTEVATIGFGQALGGIVLLLGNVFAVIAMGTSFLIIALAMRDSMHWDYGLPSWLGTTIACGVPLLIFLSGWDGFGQAIGIAGGVFVSIQLLLLLGAYWKKRRQKQSGKVIAYIPVLFWFVVIVILSGLLLTVRGLLVHP